MILNYFTKHKGIMKAVVFTLGCKVNSCESSSIMNGLEGLGYEVSDKLEYADIYVLNTCAVTKEAEKKSRQALSRIKKFNPLAKIYVIGCASQNNPDDFINKDGVQVVMGTASKDKLLKLLDKKGVFIEDATNYYEEYLPIKVTKSRSYIKIQDGCNNFCSYCLIPYLRGRIRSRSVDSIIKELEYLEPNEVVLTGINLSAYNYNGVDLAGLLELLSNFKFRIRLGSLEVNVVDDRFLNACKNLKDFAPHFHLSLQSGSNKVLKEMNRHYTKEQYLEKVELIRKYFPFAGITTDVICGFSTETMQDFEESYKTCQKAEFSDIHCFTYSKREGTMASKLKEISPSLKQERLDKMLKLKSELKENFIKKIMGKEFSFLPEYYKDGFTEGYTENYVRVYVEGKCENKITKIKIVEPFKDGCKAIKI